jgi:hypothetical protein
MSDSGLTVEHLLAGAILANGGELEFDVENVLSDEIVGKVISVTVTDNLLKVALADPDEVPEETE